MTLSKELTELIDNKAIIPFLLLLKDDYYVLVYDKDDNIIGRFVQRKGKVYEIFNMYHTENIEEYLEHKLSYSILFNISDDYQLNRYVICDEKNYVFCYRQQLKKGYEQCVSMTKDKESTYSIIRKEIDKYAGGFVSFGDNDEGLLVAACMSDEDLYWVYIKENLKVNFSSCVGGFKVISDEEYIKEHFPQLKHISETQTEDLVHLFNECFEDKIDYVFTNTKFRKE